MDYALKSATGFLTAQLQVRAEKQTRLPERLRLIQAYPAEGVEEFVWRNFYEIKGADRLVSAR